MLQSKQPTIAKQPNKAEVRQPAQMQQAPELLWMWGRPQAVMRRALNDPRSLNAAKIAYLQRSVGNQALGQVKINSHSFPGRKDVRGESLQLTSGLTTSLELLQPTKLKKEDTEEQDVASLTERSQTESNTLLKGQIQRNSGDQPWYEAAGDWALGAIGGEFIDEQSFSQIGVDFVLSIIPYVDQVADARDLVAHIYRLGFNNTYANPGWTGVGGER
jgi:hypothetical protein